MGLSCQALPNVVPCLRPSLPCSERFTRSSGKNLNRFAAVHAKAARKLSRSQSLSINQSHSPQSGELIGRHQLQFLTLTHRNKIMAAVKAVRRIGGGPSRQTCCGHCSHLNLGESGLCRVLPKTWAGPKIPVKLQMTSSKLRSKWRFKGKPPFPKAAVL